MTYNVFSGTLNPTQSTIDTIPACDGRTDRQMDGIAVANTALAMRALCAL